MTTKVEREIDEIHKWMEKRIERWKSIKLAIKHTIFILIAVGWITIPFYLIVSSRETAQLLTVIMINIGAVAYVIGGLISLYIIWDNWVVKK